MKKNLTLSFLLIFAFYLSAKQINSTDAQSIAKQFVSLSPSGLLRSQANNALNLAYTDVGVNNQNNFYVYNVGNGNGFIIVSADTRTKSILGYSDTGLFDASNMPVNLKSWLQGYSKEITYAVDSLPDTADNVTVSSILKSSKLRSSSSVVVSPLLGNIAYNQDAPYNNLCPSYNGDKTVTGCVATAMAQVMRYYQYPAQGIGSNSYTSKTHTFALSANFGNTIYDWANMPVTYSGSETDVQKAAVATLMYQVGVSVNMDYDVSSAGGSSANMSLCASALYNYFGYDAGVQAYYREYFTEDDWVTKLEAELNVGRPVLYGGQGSGGGHAFVCDGYDSNNLFHMNWGWGGSSNGYFELTALNPTDLGIGSGNGGFNYSQSIVSGIQLPVSGSVHSQVMGMGSITPSSYSIAKTGIVNFSLTNIYNLGQFTYSNGSLKLGLYNSSGTLVGSLSTVSISSLNGGYGWSTFSSFSNVSFSSYSAGTYTLKLLYKNEAGVYVPVLQSRGGNNSLNVTITDTQVTFSKNSNSPSLALTSSPTTIYNLYQNETGAFQYSVTNNGAGEYYAQLGVKLVSTTDVTVTQEVLTSVAQIGPGETKTYNLGGTITVNPGTYYIELFYDSKNDDSSSSFPDTQIESSTYVPTVTVNATPTAAPALSVVGTPNMPSTVTQDVDFSMNATIQNTGGFFNDKLIAWVFPASGGSSVTYFGYQSAILDANTSNTFTFNGNISSSIASGNYKYGIYAMISGSWTRISSTYYPFTLVVNSTTGVSETDAANSFKIERSLVSDNLAVSLPDDADRLSIYSVFGKRIQTLSVDGQSSLGIPVSQLSKGAYLLVLKTTGGQVKTLKFVKN